MNLLGLLSDRIVVQAWLSALLVALPVGLCSALSGAAEPTPSAAALALVQLTGADARAKLVRFTKKGTGAIAHGLSVLAELERELAAKIGERKMHALHEALLATEAALGEQD